jgi:hypothetical protein
MLVAAMDVFDELAEAARKRRRREGRADQPLAGKNVAANAAAVGATLDAKQWWQSGALVTRLGAEQRIRRSRSGFEGHPLVHFSDGKRVETAGWIDARRGRHGGRHARSKR